MRLNHRWLRRTHHVAFQVVLTLAALAALALVLGAGKRW